MVQPDLYNLNICSITAICGNERRRLCSSFLVSQGAWRNFRSKNCSQNARYSDRGSNSSILALIETGSKKSSDTLKLQSFDRENQMIFHSVDSGQLFCNQHSIMYEPGFRLLTYTTGLFA